MSNFSKTTNRFIGRFAAIDIGTVTCRLLVADVSVCGDDKYMVLPVDKQYSVTNLGENVDKTGLISEAALMRVRQTIERYLSIIHAHSEGDRPVQKTVAMSTSAARDADNSDVFIDMLKSLGIDLQVISGNREASLSFAGASLNYAGEKLVVVDVGGGSTEVSIGVGGGKPKLLHSFNIGCRRVTEKYWDGYPPSDQAIEEAGAWIRSQLNQWMVAYDESIFIDNPTSDDKLAYDRLKMIAVAGTATSAVTMRDKIYPYDSSKVDGVSVSINDINSLISTLSKMKLAEIESIVGLDPARAPVITAGMLILREVMQAFRVDAFLASESDILDAMVISAADENFCR